MVVLVVVGRAVVVDPWAATRLHLAGDQLRSAARAPVINQDLRRVCFSNHRGTAPAPSVRMTLEPLGGTPIISIIVTSLRSDYDSRAAEKRICLGEREQQSSRLSFLQDFTTSSRSVMAWSNSLMQPALLHAWSMWAWEGKRVPRVVVQPTEEERLVWGRCTNTCLLHPGKGTGLLING